MKIKDWPSGERPREKLLADGARTLSDAELLAILLRHGTPRNDAVSLARGLLSSSGSLRELLEADLLSFCSLPGCGPAGFATIKAALELSQRYVYATLKRDGPLQTPSDAGTYLISRMKAYRREVFACLFLDTRHRVIAFRELFFGSVDSAQVHPREIIRACLEFNCAAVILAHNHPSGVAEPSAADRAITQRIVEAAGMVDVRVLDHLIVGECDVVSMAELGLL
ncbi:MAG: DNA repair protein RadC [Proteobacteria bacterium]|nr:DNA repair protein RadC [Pseudomonadota bacterium]